MNHKKPEWCLAKRIFFPPWKGCPKHDERKSQMSYLDGNEPTESLHNQIWKGSTQGTQAEKAAESSNIIFAQNIAAWRDI